MHAVALDVAAAAVAAAALAFAAAVVAAGAPAGAAHAAVQCQWGFMSSGLLAVHELRFLAELRSPRKA